ncbi:hypothetical protein BGX23_012507, partial [Mortierella sp. AD031]
MSTSTNRFFNTPELVLSMAEFLDKFDSSCLSRTCQRLQGWIESQLYKDLTVKFEPKRFNIFASPDSVLALVRNALYVQSLHLGMAETIYFDGCICAHTSPVSPLPAATSLQVVPIPPLTNLTELDLELDLCLHRKYDHVCPYFKLPDTAAVAAATAAGFAQTCGLLQLSENLVKVKVHHLPIQCRQDFNLFARAIASLPRLEELNLHICVAHDTEGSLKWFDVFFMCQSSIRKFQVDVGCAERSEMAVITIAEDVDDGRGGGVASETRSIAASDGSKAPTDGLSLFYDNGGGQVHSGTRPKLGVPTSSTSGWPFLSHDFVKIVVDCCPLLKRVFVSALANVDGFCLPTDLMTTIQEQQVEEFECNDYGAGFLEGPEASMTFLRHSKTLRRVYVESYTQANSEAMCAVLFVCEVLEDFKTNDGIRSADPSFYINLDGAVSRPWACKGLRHLKLSFGIARFDQEPYYNRSPMVTLTDEEQEQFGVLERLYRQIGLLTELSYLDLKALALDDQGQPIGSLGDEDTGRPGYLALLGGLKKLKVLRGSFYADTNESKMTMGWPEVRWMTAYWLKLEVA